MSASTFLEENYMQLWLFREEITYIDSDSIVEKFIMPFTGFMKSVTKTVSWFE